MFINSFNYISRILVQEENWGGNWHLKQERVLPETERQGERMYRKIA